ncbi:hypothetical protein Mnod_2034 [Methylobacterium nodulans ORS 2060]|uniref:Uncharacterized protein n=1 Tax=Methylobacterium nodulans (strain LMG 21967 / CNCM I-2342 / ORS 2060) TaxID=460265 RepID=B8ITD4_METNO|nr:hypothetical protein Mnod_2034 [Methylobacterium nodulans ORS 2060]
MLGAERPASQDSQVAEPIPATRRVQASVLNPSRSERTASSLCWPRATRRWSAAATPAVLVVGATGVAAGHAGLASMVTISAGWTLLGRR